MSSRFGGSTRCRGTESTPLSKVSPPWRITLWYRSINGSALELLSTRFQSLVPKATSKHRKFGAALRSSTFVFFLANMPLMIFEAVAGLKQGACGQTNRLPQIVLDSFAHKHSPRMPVATRLQAMAPVNPILLVLSVIAKTTRSSLISGLELFDRNKGLGVHRFEGLGKSQVGLIQLLARHYNDV